MREGPQVLPACPPGKQPLLQDPGSTFSAGPWAHPGPGCAHVCVRPAPTGSSGTEQGTPAVRKPARAASPATHTSQARRPAREPGVSSQGSGPQSTVAWGERPAPTPAWRRHGGHGVRPPAPPGGLPCLSRALILARGRFGPTPSDSTYSHRGGEGSPPQLPPLTHHCPMTPVKPLASAPSPRLQVGL